MKKPVSIVTQILWTIAIIAGGALLFSHREAALAFLGGELAPANRPLREPRAGAPVIAAPATETTDDAVIEAVGSAAARRSAILRVKVEGAVVDRPFDAASRVTEGALLLRLDDRQERLALELAETRLADAARRLDRLTRLRGSGSTSEASQDDAATAVEIARIERDRAADALADRVVLAPFDGVTGIPEVNVGDRVDPDVEIASIDDRSALYVEFRAPEAYLSRLAAGVAVTARTPAFPAEEFAGAVVEIDSRVDPVSRTVRVRAEIPNRDDRLRPGMSFAVRVALGGRVWTSVPELALQWEREGAFVWRVIAEKAVKTPVRLVSRRDGLALVDGELAPGDPVVVEGVQRLRPDRPVQVLDGASGGAGANSGDGQRGS